MHRCLLCIVLLTGLAEVSLADPVTGEPGRTPTARLREALESETLIPLAVQLAEDLRVMSTQLESIHRDDLIDLAACGHLAEVYGDLLPLADAERKVLVELTRRPVLLRSLAFSLRRGDDPRKALHVLARLVREHPKELNRWAELAAAICVTWDERTGPIWDQRNRGAADPEQAEHVFRYFTRASESGRLPADLRRMPAELLVWVVDLRTADRDWVWALERYGRNRTPASSFFDVTYAPGMAPSRNNEDRYTLPALFKSGGGPLDQAHFAEQVCRSIGVPAAAFVASRGPSEQAFAWIAALDLGARPYWDFEEGRADALLHWTGETRDPQTGRRVTGDQLAGTAALLGSSREDRHFAGALRVLADVAPAEPRVDLLTEAVARSPGDWESWRRFLAAARTPALDREGLRAAMKAVERHGLFAPRFAIALADELIADESAAVQLAVYERLSERVKNAPVVHARLLVRRADVHAAAGQVNRAERLYRRVMDQFVVAGPVVAEATAGYRKLLAREGRVGEALRQINFLRKRLDKPETTPYVEGTLWWQLGLQLGMRTR